MKIFILKRLLRGGQKRILLIVELFFSFIAFFFILTFIIGEIDNTKYPLGFDYKNLYKVDIDVTAQTDDMDVVMENFRNIMRYVRAYPGTQNFGRCQSSFFFMKEGYMNPSKPLKSKDIAVPSNLVNQILASDEVAEVLNLKLLEGRWFSVEDNASKNRPVVLTQNLKERMFGSENALGEIVDYCGQQCIVVGVCNDIKHKGDYTQPELTIFIRNVDVEDLPYETWMCMSGSFCGQNLLLKCNADLPASFEEDLTRKVAVNFPGYNIKLTSMEKIRQKYIRSTWAPLVAIFLVISALFLNVLFGLFGVLWYNISQRTSEIGLRMAVGASKGQVYRQFVHEMMLLTTVGIVPGIIAAVQFPFLGLFQMESRVYVFAMIAAALIIYALVAICVILPSFRATKIQPAHALHEE
ncbi:MAG: ABC transporter permease [Cytophagales bacterium]|nr:ABC transporter permease [Cytophagales bacterium]